MNNLYIYSIIQIFFAIILIWLTTLIMIEKKKILAFIPFFIVGVVSCFYAGFVFYEVFVNFAWFFIEFLYLISIIWIFINLRRKNGVN